MMHPEPPTLVPLVPSLVALPPVVPSAVFRVASVVPPPVVARLTLLTRRLCWMMWRDPSVVPPLP